MRARDIVVPFLIEVTARWSVGLHHAASNGEYANRALPARALFREVESVRLSDGMTPDLFKLNFHGSRHTELCTLTYFCTVTLLHSAAHAICTMSGLHSATRFLPGMKYVMKYVFIH